MQQAPAENGTAYFCRRQAGGFYETKSHRVISPWRGESPAAAKISPRELKATNGNIRFVSTNNRADLIVPVPDELIPHQDPRMHASKPSTAALGLFLLLVAIGSARAD